MDLPYFRILMNALLNKDLDIVWQEGPLIILDSKSDVCKDKNSKDTNHIRHITRRVYFVSDGKSFKMHNVHWFEGGLQLEDIATKTVGENDLITRTRYIMVRLK